MTYYIEITLIPNSDMGLFSVWSKVYTQLHLALVELKDVNSRVPVGVSFAEYKHSERHGILGSKLRLFASEMSHLEKLNLYHWFDRLSDYVHISSIRAVPSEHRYVVVSRVRTPKNIGNLTRRYAKRHGVFLEDALEKYQNYEANKSSTNLPFIKIKSLSSSRDFNLCILQRERPTAQSGLYSTYGLSNTSTVPHW